ncbi:uncharacterized protein N7458_011263 [Penicillium daleae]|uniref:Uncharacterized protein n=1 Tax=Penicillium daleae TaxID=63821 RepID=A0AAD6FW80_9EURO|nr:uncharacterized protein N7458_011263 [Penicillium daleae]KAJ5432107.1 hypothetical protein N7458_011263 [Penicillium daleae]
MILENPLSVISLSRLLDVSERFIHTRLNSSHPVLTVPDDKTSSVRLFHPSFRDFILNPEIRKKTPFWVDKKARHCKLTKQCLRMCHNLRRNICGLPSDGTQRTEVNQLTIDRNLPWGLQSACRYWVNHLIQCTDLIGMMHDALLFLQRHFLNWVEAMSLLGLTNESSPISDFLHDARRFILKNRQMSVNNSNKRFRLGYASHHELKKRRAQNYRRSKTIRLQLSQWPSRPTAGSWRPAPWIKQYASGIRRQSLWSNCATTVYISKSTPA